MTVIVNDQIKLQTAADETSIASSRNLKGRGDTDDIHTDTENESLSQTEVLL